MASSLMTGKIRRGKPHLLSKASVNYFGCGRKFTSEHDRYLALDNVIQFWPREINRSALSHGVIQMGDSEDRVVVAR